MAHAPFAPSAAKRWMTCPGSYLLGKGFPEAPDSEYAAEGTRLHDVAAKLILDPLPVAQEASQDDIKFLAPYLKHGDIVSRRCNPAGYFAVEQFIDFSPLLHGTADLLGVGGEDIETMDDTSILFVSDLKTGRGVQVPVEENPQLMTYAWLALVTPPERGGIGSFYKGIKRCRFAIAQPTIDGPMEVREWECPVERVLEHGEAVLDAIETAQQPSARENLVPGEHCRWCNVKPSCPKLTGMSLDALKLPALAGFSPQQMSEWLDRADLLMTFVDALRERAHQALRDGYTIPGYMLKPKRATRGWANEEAVLAYARDKKIRIFQEPKLMSPAMAEKAYPKGLPEPIKSQIVSVSSGTNLVKGDAPRESNQPRTLQGALSNLIYRV